MACASWLCNTEVARVVAGTVLRVCCHSKRKLAWLWVWLPVVRSRLAGAVCWCWRLSVLYERSTQEGRNQYAQRSMQLRPVGSWCHGCNFFHLLLQAVAQQQGASGTLGMAPPQQQQPPGSQAGQAGGPMGGSPLLGQTGSGGLQGMPNGQVKANALRVLGRLMLPAKVVRLDAMRPVLLVQMHGLYACQEGRSLTSPLKILAPSRCRALVRPREGLPRTQNHMQSTTMLLPCRCRAPVHPWQAAC